MKSFLRQRCQFAVVLVLVVCGLAGCSSQLTTTLHRIREQVSPERLPQPDYQPGVVYLPLGSTQGPAYMVKAFDDAGVQVWYARPALMLRTRQGVIVGARGFSQELSSLDMGNCPPPAQMLREAQPLTCTRTRNLPVAYGRVEQIRFERPLLLESGWQGVPGPVRVVRETVLSGLQKGNVYGFDAEGKMVFSRQWITPGFGFNLGAERVGAARAASTSSAAPSTDAQAAPQVPATSHAGGEQ